MRRRRQRARAGTTCACAEHLFGCVYASSHKSVPPLASVFTIASPGQQLVRARPPEPHADAPLYARYTARIMVLPDAIFEAIQRAPYGDGWDLIRGYLDAGGDVNEVGRLGKTILHRFLATNYMDEAEHLQFVRFLIERGADVNKVDRYGRNALFFACNSGGVFGIDVVRAIVDAGANIDAKATSSILGQFTVGETPLSTAMNWMRRWNSGTAMNRALAYASLLIRRGASIDDCWEGRTAERCLRDIEHPSNVNHSSFIALKAIIADARRRKLRELSKGALTLRTLALRDRAAPADPIIKFIVSLPDGVAWNLLSYWPPRRFPHYIRASTYRGPRPGYVFTTRTWCPLPGLPRKTKTGYFLDNPRVKIYE